MSETTGRREAAQSEISDSDRTDSIGDLAVMQVKTALRGQRIDSETCRALRQTLPTLAATVEELCPAVLEITPGGIVSAYGPLLGGEQRVGRHVFIFATNEGHGMALAADGRRQKRLMRLRPHRTRAPFIGQRFARLFSKRKQPAPYSSRHICLARLDDLILPWDQPNSKQRACCP